MSFRRLFFDAGPGREEVAVPSVSLLQSVLSANFLAMVAFRAVALLLAAALRTSRRCPPTWEGSKTIQADAFCCTKPSPSVSTGLGVADDMFAPERSSDSPSTGVGHGFEVLDVPVSVRASQLRLNA